jgi:hypothetical protein
MFGDGKMNITKTYNVPDWIYNVFYVSHPWYYYVIATIILTFIMVWAIRYIPICYKATDRG